ncbi:helix-turn-helix domain-containing protein [Paenibacillus naphthalenovorans]|uniref:AlbA family DNA-binding domain-containing protein n=1 Tax=Paenibacillus naphthalenovorans TaxID=162209 RepID=UPI0007851380|nr:RNA-binding domain-containing protein [Paenibacillus naphthalenovorans]
MRRFTSLANTYGGDFLLGIDAPENGPIKLSGISTEDTDKELLKYINILQNGVEPKLPQVQTKIFEVGENRYVFLFRVGRSWLRPHRVKGSSKFYSRKSNGKFPLDVFELRNMFSETTEFSKKVKEFREERALEYMLEYNNSSPFTLIHLIPITCFENRYSLDLSLIEKLRLAPIASAGWNPRINFDGIYSNTSDNASSMQIFKNGIIEGATIRLTREGRIPSTYFVEKITEFIGQSISNFEIMDMKEPFYVSISMFGVAGYEFAVDPMKYFFFEQRKLKQDKLIFPEILIEDRTKNLKEQLRPIFDSLWNAFGQMRYKE